ncbi:MAG: DUF4175 family protein, partial [Pseudomonadota bacterium]
MAEHPLQDPNTRTQAISAPQVEIDAAKARLRGRIQRTRWALAAERLARALWPLASVALVLYAAYAFGLAHMLARPGLIVAGLLCALALGAAAIWGLRQLSWPTLADARARLDAALPGTPLQTLDDEIAVGR